MNQRISRDEMLFMIAQTVAKRSTCLRRSIGALLVVDGRILSIGYNGAPPGQPHCLEEGCLIDPDTGGCNRTQHAEANTIAWAARHGIRTAGSVLYTTVSPCLTCAKMIITSGITKVLYFEEYRDTAPMEYLRDAGVECLRYYFPDPPFDAPTDDDLPF